MNKKRVYHFHNGTGGGVLSVIRNLLKYSVNEEIENHVIYPINKDQFKNFCIPNLKGALTQQVFYYSPKWNFYYISKKLSRLLADGESLIIAHDWLELGMTSNLGLQNPLVFFLHGDYEYYYHLAVKYSETIDKFVTVAGSIETKLKTKLPRYNNISYLRFPVPETTLANKQSEQYGIIFIGRLTNEKGYHLLPIIAKHLQNKELNVTWHIVGSSNYPDEEAAIWDKRIKVNFYGNITNEKVYKLLMSCHFFILPSTAEGMPVTLIEAMKSGVIPIVNDINGGIQELVIDNITGYKIKQNDVDSYCRQIVRLIKDQNLTEQLRVNCIQKATDLFNPEKNTAELEKLFIKAINDKKKKMAYKGYGSRLDNTWLPNLFVRTIRTIIKKEF